MLASGLWGCQPWWSNGASESDLLHGCTAACERLVSLDAIWPGCLQMSKNTLKDLESIKGTAASVVFWILLTLLPQLGFLINYHRSKLAFTFLTLKMLEKGPRNSLSQAEAENVLEDVSKRDNLLESSKGQLVTFNKILQAYSSTRVKFLWDDTSFPSLKLPVLRVPQMNQCILSYTFSFAILSVGAPMATTCPWTICEFFPTICPCMWDGSFFEAFEGFGPLGLPDTDRVDRTCWAEGSPVDSGCTIMLGFSFLKPAKPPPQTTHKSTATIATIASECWLFIMLKEKDRTKYGGSLFSIEVLIGNQVKSEEKWYRLAICSITWSNGKCHHF